MSITSALSNALSGLAANARAVDVVSTNLANIQTEGYARRDIELTPHRPGTTGGVRVIGVTRHVDAAVLGDHRMAQSALAHAETRAGFIAGVEDAVGTPDRAGSLSARIAAFETSLISAATRPDAQNRLLAVSQRATELTMAFNSVSDDIQTRRQAAEGEIEAAVQTLNTALGQVRALNHQIAASRQRGGDTASLEDHRQTVIDRVATYIPVREVPRDNGTVALMTPGGVQLLDGAAATLAFTRANVIAPHMTRDNGMLSGLTVNGRAITPSGARSPIAGGRLSALFDVRDDLAVAAQADIDALARDMIGRFQDPAVDNTLSAGDAGLFTDAGAAFAVADEIGVAGRIALTTLVDPDRGGALHRLRDGLGAAVPGPQGNARLLNALTGALAGRRALNSGTFGAGPASAAGHADTLASHLGQQQLTADGMTSFARASAAEMGKRLQMGGVDSDAETQRLLLIEQAYSANARMIRTLDEMMQTILRI